MIEEDPAGGGQLDTPRAADHELSTDLVLKIPHLTAERRLCGVQTPLGRDCQAPLLGDGDEISKMSQLHARPMPARYGPKLTKSFSTTPQEPMFLPRQTFWFAFSG